MKGHIGLEFLDFNVAAELAYFASRKCLVVRLDAVQNSPVTPYGAGFDYLEIGGDEAGLPFILITDRPDDPELVGAATDRLFDVGIGDVNRINVRLSIDVRRRKPHRERDTSHQHVFRHVFGFDHLKLFTAEVEDVERPIEFARANLLPVQSP